MFVSIALIAVGFLMGVVLTGSIACLVIGFLHAEAVKAVESYGAMYLFSNVRPDAATYKAVLP